MKRENYLSWDSYFIGIAFLSALRSKDPSTINGACIVDNENHIISTGYNGFPIGCSDDEFPWGRIGEEIDTKYPYVIHAETNAIHNSKRDINGCRLYLYSEKGYYPCSECAKNIVQTGIKEVILAFATDLNTDKYNWDITKRIFKSANVKTRIIEKNNLIINLNHINLNLFNLINTIKSKGE